jgi:hypothetical protein
MQSANGNDNPNNQPNDKGWFCPSCGGAAVEASTLAGGNAKCNVCSWTGKTEDLATFHFSHDGGTPEEVFHRFFMDIRKLLSRPEVGVQIGLLLIKWGFLNQPDKKSHDDFKKDLSRYIGHISKSVVESISKTRADIEKERHGNANAGG